MRRPISVRFAPPWPPRGGEEIRRRAALIALGAVGTACLVALYAPVASALVTVWATVPYYSYGFLIPIFAGYGLWEARRRLATVQPTWSAAGLALLIGGLTTAVAGTAIGSLTLQALSFPVVLAGIALLLLGPARFGAIAFPLGFLLFMAPLPEGAISAISPPLQGLAASFAAHALALLGIPTVRQGFDIFIPGVVLNVTEDCNGLRFLLAMIVVGTAFAWTTQRETFGRAAVLGLAVISAIAANLVRVTGTGVLAYYYGPAAAMGFFHVLYGKVVYLAMLVPFIAGVVLLRRAGRPRRAADAA